ncbi:hypothetical protein ACI2KW_30405, partial [Pseudomonas aeruginosa]
MRGSGQEQQQRGQQQPLPRRAGQAAQPRKTQSRICRKTESRNVAKGMPTLVQHVTNGFNAMPPRGLCTDCSAE